MKRVHLLTSAFLLLGMLIGSQAMAQGRIELGRAQSTQNCANVSQDGFSATFTFSSIEATEVNTEKGMFSTLTMDGTYPSGNLGEPSLPAANKLIAVPYGVKNLTVNVKSYSTSIYKLADYGINKVTPMQPMIRKDQKPEDVPFAYSEKAYATKGFVNRPIAQVQIQGTMRGIQIGALTVNPVQYDAATNTIQVYNDIEVEVSYGQYDKSAAYDEFARTFSPYFANIYDQMFNWRDDVYDEHPDLWQNPVHMLVVADRMFEECLQPWFEWKTKKGFYLNVKYTDEIGTSAAAIRAAIQDEYSKDAPTFLMIMGDKNQVAASATGSETHCVTDLQYSSVDGDEFPDMYHSRFPAETVAQMQAMINKGLEYEQYTMPDPSYLNNVLLIAGEDSGWGVTVGRPTIWYATNYYYNEEHGYANVYEYSHGQYTGCYSHLNEGVGFANYTAHGSNTSWAGPQFTVSDVNNLTNEHKYFLAMGNCCEAADWGISGTCFGEAMVRAENKAAYAYIGSCPSTYWLNDYYFGVGATSQANGQMPDISITTTGFYDAMWTDDMYNTVTSMMFIGNLAGNAAQALGYQIHVSTLYCWQAYHTLGDGSILPFRIQPTENTISHMPTLPIGMDFFTVSAAPGSYVGISKDGVLYGAGMIGESGTADIPIQPVTSGGEVTICVTHPRHIPYITEIPAAAMEGAYIAVDNVQCDQPLVSGAYVAPTVRLKNVGIEAANNINVELSTESEYIELLQTTATVPAIAPDATYDIAGAFGFNTAVNIPNGTRVRFFVNCTSGSDVWEGRFDLTFGAPEFAMTNISNTELQPGGSAVVTFDITNTGSLDAQNAVLQIVTSSSDLTFEVNSIEIPAIAAGETVSVNANLNVAANVQNGVTYELSYLLSDGHYTLSGTAPISVGTVGDNFETGDFSTFDYTFAGSANWTIVNTGAYEGTYCAKSGHITDNQDSQLILTVEVLSTGEFSFYKKVSSENSYDKLYFLIDGSAMGDWSGENDWSQQTYTVTPGTHTFKWRYAKDSSVSSGSDCAWIDCIQLPPTSVILSLDAVTDLEAITDGNAVNLTWTGSTGATSYLIYRNGEQIANQAGTSYTDNVNDGIYTYSIIATDGNRYSSAAFVTVDVGTVGIEESVLETMSIYPNPVGNLLTIAGGNTEYTYTMYNGMGQVVANGTANGIEQINVESMAKGIYFLHIATGTQVRVEKIVVE